MVRTFGKLALALGLAVVLADLASGQQPFGGFGGGMLLANPDVAKEIKLTEEQQAKVKEVGTQVRDKFKDEFSKLKDLGQDERRQKFTEIGKKMSEETQKALAGVLNADQTKRLKQLELQAQGVRAFSDAEVVKALNISEDQAAKIKTIGEDAQKEMGEIFKNAQGNFQEAFKKIGEMRKTTLEKATNVLNDTQKKAWKDLTGAPFEFNFQPRRPGTAGTEE